jgi:hypothetical protein
MLAERRGRDKGIRRRETQMQLNPSRICGIRDDLLRVFGE